MCAVPTSALKRSELLAFSSGIVFHFQEHTVGLEVKMAVFDQNITCLKMKSGLGGGRKIIEGPSSSYLR